MHASFFLTGRFYAKYANEVRKLKNACHYLGAHSDQHLLYCDWKKRDSLLVSKAQFSNDLAANYKRMLHAGIRKKDAGFFLPPYEWYNSAIVSWTAAEGLTLVNFTPGTRSAADYTWPEMGAGYRSSEEIYKSIMEYKDRDPHGLNGFILLLHIGTDKRRRDKFYLKLDELLQQLQAENYRFVRINELLAD